MKNRIRFTALVFLLLFIALAARLFYWQMVKGPELAARAESQYYDSLELPADRGTILDATESVLAGSVPTHILYAYKPNFLGDISTASRQLAQILYREEEAVATTSGKEEIIEQIENQIAERLTRKSVWEILEKKVSGQQKQELERLGIPGLGFQLTSSRFYPEASSSAHLLGFVGSDAAGKQKGYFGLEGYYDRELRGIDGTLRQERDALGHPILVGSFREIPPQTGRKLTAYIDRYIQNIVEEELKRGLERYGATAGEVVVMDPKTGGIIASASYPNYNPETYWKFDPSSLANSTISQAYEPGSTFKVLVMAAAIDAGVVGPDTPCEDCSGPVQIGSYTIRTWDGKYQPNLTMTNTIVHSDNTGMVFVAEKLGEQRLLEYLSGFGIGELTGIDLQGERAPAMRNKWSRIDLATASFGQGVAVTTLQMLRAVGAIANGGQLMTPQVISSISGKEQVDISPKPVRQVISPATAAQITEMMVEAVVAGEAKFAAPKGYRIAGKTGTAQIPVAGHYDKEKTITSFVGFAPADDPKFVMITKFSEPTSSQWGSETAAPMWFSIAKKLLLYWGIPPDQ